MVQTRNPRTLVAAEVVAFGGGDDGEEMMMMALGGVGWQQWWYKWSGEAAAVMNREPLFEDILGATTQRDTGSYYPKIYWQLLPKEILGAITQRDTGSYYLKRDWDVLWENGGHGDEGGGESWRSLRYFFSLYIAVFGQPTSVPVKWLSFTNRNSDEAQTSEHG
ncbi:hypothetical protein Tco_0734198 [Tanacetum coccineum]